MIYLDHNATTPLRPEVAEAVARAAVELPGNPSSVHSWGRRARDAVERARRQVADFLGAAPEEIVFTSGGTEGNHLAVRGLCAGTSVRARRHLVTSPIEHPSVLGAVEGAAAAAAACAAGRGGVTTVAVSARGEIALADVEAAMREDTALVTLALANHELGNLYPVERFAASARARGALIHTDAVQAAGKIALDLKALGVDAATISAHKLGGPKGAGAVFVRRGLDLAPILAGGHQERERRPGTENVAAIVGFGVACEAAALELSSLSERMETLRHQLRALLAPIPGVRLLGVDPALDGRSTSGAAADEQARRARLPGTLMVAFAGAPGQLVAVGLDLEGVCVSTGAACTSGSLEPSPVLRALGLEPVVAAEGLRVSLGRTTTAADVVRLGELLPLIVARVRAAVAAGTNETSSSHVSLSPSRFVSATEAPRS